MVSVMIGVRERFGLLHNIFAYYYPPQSETRVYGQLKFLIVAEELWKRVLPPLQIGPTRQPNLVS